MPTTKAIELF